MNRLSFLLTLFAGDATREFTYAARGGSSDEIVVIEQSDWDFPVSEPIGRAEVEIMNGAGSRRVLTIKGATYLALCDVPGVIEGMLEAISRGKPVLDALEQAKLAASIAS